MVSPSALNLIINLIALAIGVRVAVSLAVGAGRGPGAAAPVLSQKPSTKHPSPKITMFMGEQAVYSARHVSDKQS